MIVDAAFLRAAERADFADLARELGVPFGIVDCSAPLAVLRERLAQRRARGGDPSEADETVLDRLWDAAEPLSDSERSNTLVAEPTRGVDSAFPNDAPR